MGNLLEAPITEKNSHEEFEGGVSIGVTGMQGWRPEMEDDHLIQAKMPSAEDHMLLGVFDGHGGAKTAQYVAPHLVEKIESMPSWQTYLENQTEENVGIALTEAFLAMDQELRERSEEASGCTAIVVMLTPSFIVTANLGDSRAVLGSNGSTVALSFDHKPYNEEEKRRIEKAGGTVSWNRVDGDLAVSRAFGDFRYKSVDLPQEEQKVTPEPEIQIQPMSDQHEFVVLACDGVWDVMSNEEVTEEVRRLLAEGEERPQLIAEELVDISLEKQSKDNISCLVALLPGCESYKRPGLGVQGRREAREAEVKARNEALARSRSNNGSS
jgi:serine/threonine protein phosphatase PrpC